MTPSSDSPEQAVDEELALRGEQSAMVLLVDDQIMVVEAIRRSLANQPNIAFHFCVNPAAARPADPSRASGFERPAVPG